MDEDLANKHNQKLAWMCSLVFAEKEVQGACDIQWFC